MPQELRQNNGYGSISEAISNYLDPQQAKPETLRMLLANLSQDVGELTGMNRTAPELKRDFIQSGKDIASYAMRGKLGKYRDQLGLGKEGTHNEENAKLAMAMMMMLGGKGSTKPSKGLMAKYPEAFTPELRKAYLAETRYNRGLMKDIGETPSFKYDEPRQIYGTSSVSDEPLFNVGTSTPKNLEAYKKFMKLREQGKYDLADQVRKDYPELVDMLNNGGDVAIVTTRGTKGLEPELNNFGALEDVPYSHATDEALFRDPETLRFSNELVDDVFGGKPIGDLGIEDIGAAQEYLRNASEEAQFRRMLEQNRNYLSYPIAKDYLKHGKR